MNSDKTIIERHKQYFRVLHQADLAALRELYAGGVVFRGPVNEIRGIVRLEDYYANLCAEFDECRFEFLDEAVGERTAYIKWIMHFKLPGPRSKPVSVRGVSHLRWGDRIEYQEDFYDMGAMPCEQSPARGNLSRWLRLRLAS